MSDKSDRDDETDRHRDDALRRSIESRRRRKAMWEREGERSLAQNLAMVGALGWLIVVPTLLGGFLGRWLDGLLDTGVQFTLPGVFLGVGLGAWMAWRRMNEE